MPSQALVARWIESRTSRKEMEIAAVLGGSLYLALLAQVTIPLPFTPVPITGQTFGVATLALLWGRKRALAAFGAYLAEGALGLPVFAGMASFLRVGPTIGYLIGMAASCAVIGTLADQGRTKTFRSAFLACVLGSSCVFTGGLIGLSFFLPREQLLSAGFLPFLPGDLIKNTVAAGLATLLGKSERA